MFLLFLFFFAIDDSLPRHLGERVFYIADYGAETAAQVDIGWKTVYLLSPSHNRSDPTIINVPVFCKSAAEL